MVEGRQQEGAKEPSKLMHYKEYINFLEKRAQTQDREYKKKATDKYRRFLFDSGASSTFICKNGRKQTSKL